MKVYVSCVIDHPHRMVPFSQRAKTVSSKRGGRLRVEEVKDRSKRKQRGRGKRRKRVQLMVGMNQVDLNHIDVVSQCFSGKIPRSQMYNETGNSRNIQ